MFRPVFLMVPAAMLMPSFPAFAQPLPISQSLDAQRLVRELTPTNAQDFFKQGQAQFEHEIRVLERRSQPPQEELLKIDPAVRNFERLNFQSQPLTINLKR
ncbi:hypothetical protein H6F89_14830 [Cyanobacteria bacterium FACHB-63]|nr:hypothetical protein [Cyanobacteria bacterium FACHB-63]